MTVACSRRLVQPDTALERWIGSPGVSWPRVALTQLPTRVHLLAQWSTVVGTELWIKRDDETSSLYGGNKPRKLEYLLGAALERGYKSVFTFGGLGSHHALATALFARELGLRTIVGLLYQPVTPSVRDNLLCLHTLGAELLYGKRVASLAAVSIGKMLSQLLRGEPPFLIPTGGSSPLGTLGYVNAGLEFAEQIERSEVPLPAVIFVPLGSGGTVAGLTLGLRLAGLSSRVVGVLVTDILPPTPRRLLRLARKTAQLLGSKGAAIADRLTSEDFIIERRFVGRGYGAPIPEAEQLGMWLREHEGIQLDSTYTAKTAYALESGVREGCWGRGPFLFWQTFGGSLIVSRLAPLPDFRQLPAPFRQFFDSEKR
ncbi:MAG: pyridoxal-phosphate dependent enzyme [Candidatus Binatia bacterium]|nr:pyridoxal-phosphate dependent enzyme [Candidatus Binatia bacterium]